MKDLFVHDPSVEVEKDEKDGSPVMKEGENMKKVKERPVYSHDEAVEASIKYFNGDELAARVWANKYALKDSFGNLFEKTPDDMHRRLAREIHRVELKY